MCVEAIRAVIEAPPTYGVRMTHARLSKGQGIIVNRKQAHRIMRLYRWTCKQRRSGQRPRVEHRKSIAAARATVASYIEQHNTQRPHSALNNNTLRVHKQTGVRGVAHRRVIRQWSARRAQSTGRPC